MTLTILGAGELGGRVAARFGGRVVALTATDRRHAALASIGAEPTTAWPSVAPDDAVVLALSGSARQLDAIRRLAEGPLPARAVLVSTTGFHRPYVGAIGPGSPPGDEDRARQAATTEAAFRAWAGDRGAIVRCGGLWHATRGPAAAFRRSGTAPVGPPDDALPLVHYDDAATLVLAALDADAPVLLAVTAAPTREAFYTAAASAFGVPVPAFGAARGATARFDDPRASALLGEPAFPDWQAALAGG